MAHRSVVSRSSTLGAALAAFLAVPFLLAAPFLLATTPAAADDERRRGHRRYEHHRHQHHRHQHNQHHRPHHGFSGFYGAPPPYAVVRPPPVYGYPPPYAAYARPRLQCRDWNGPVWINGRHEMVFGTICRMPDGNWQLMD